METDDVLNELRALGALGRAKKASSEVEESKTPSGVWERDPRIGPTQDALREVGERLVVLREAQQAFEAAFGKVFAIWEGEPSVEVRPPEAPSESVEPSERSVPKLVRQIVPTDQSPEALQRARESALRKIRGEDIQDEAARRALFSEAEEDDVPFVGQTRVRMEPVTGGETTVGTLGVIKPSFPKEEKSDA